MFTNRVRAIRKTISNPDHYRAIRNSVANRERYRAIGKTVTDRDRYRAIGRTVTDRDRYRAVGKTVTDPERYRTIGRTVTDRDRYRAIGKSVANPEHYRKIGKVVRNPHHYPAAVLAVAAVAVGVAPLTASAASGHSSAPAAVAGAAPQTGTSAGNGPSTGTSDSGGSNSGSTAPQAQAAKPGAGASTPSQPQSQPQSQAPAQPDSQSQDKSSNSAPQTEQAKDPAPTRPFAGASISQLEPNGTDGGQSYIPLNSAQWTNATTIVNTAENLHMSPYAATIAVATSMQESKLQNLTVAVDHDSLGLFQQRPSTGWGSPSELEDPTYAATAFLQSLPAGYQNMQLDVAAQSVQRSFDGSLYAQWEDQAAHIVYTIVNN